MSKKLFIVLVLLLGINIGKAENKDYSIINHRNGNQIHLITTSDSSVFIGTSNGVYQRNYAGKITNVLNKEKGLLNDFSQLVFAEHDDKIWVATDNGLHLSNGNNYLVFNQSSGLLNNTVTAMCSGLTGDTWVANASGLSQFKDNEWHSYGIPIISVDTVFFNSIASNDGSIWGTTAGHGLYAFDGSKWTNYTTTDGLAADHLLSLAKDTHNTLWMATPNNGLIEHDAGWTTHYNSLLDTRTINDFCIDKNNTKWIFTTRGVIKLEDNAWSMPDGLSTMNAKKGSVDSENNLWLIANDLVIKYIPSRDSIASYKVESLIYNGVTSIFVDADDAKWIATYKGISILDKGWTNIPSTQINNTLTNPYNTYNALQQDADKNMWISCGNPANVSRFDLKAWETDHSASAPYSGGQIAFALDSKKVLWAGTQGRGIEYFDGQQWRSPSSINNLLSNNVTCIAFDKEDNLWIGTETKGISKFDGSSYTNYQMGIQISGIAIDSENKVWASTWNRDDLGLIMFNGSAWKTFSVEDGLAEKYVRSIVIDQFDQIWCGHQESGISVYNQKNNAWTYLTWADGLAHYQIGALAVDAKNNVYAGTPNGLSVIKPSSVALNVLAQRSTLKSTKAIMEVPVSVGNFNKIKRVDFTLHFDKNILKFRNFTNGALYGMSMDNFNVSDTINGNITIHYENKSIACQSISDGSDLFHLSFEVIAPTKDSSEVSLSGIVVENYQNVKLNYRVNTAKFKIADWISTTAGIRVSTHPMVVYPNPARALVTIESEEKMKELVLVDEVGQILKTINPNDERTLSINMADIKPGIYLLKIHTASELKVVKLIKQR